MKSNLDFGNIENLYSLTFNEWHVLSQKWNIFERSTSGCYPQIRDKKKYTTDYEYSVAKRQNSFKNAGKKIKTK